MNPWEEIEQNYDFICGIDEVGRGCFVGLVVACAVIMPKGSRINGVKDSKKLSEKQRKKLSGLIREEALGIGFGIQDAEVIDLINIKQATRLAMKDAVCHHRRQRSCRTPRTGTCPPAVCRNG